MDKLIYKISPTDLWNDAVEAGEFTGAPIDVSDGYIHFSMASQARETARRHFAGQSGLVLVAVRANDLGDDLKYEVSRGGDLFPHLYAALPLVSVEWVKPLPLNSSGEHVFPETME